MKTKEMTARPEYENRTHYNFNLTKHDMEYNNGPSLTVPDQAFTVKEVLEKYTNGVLPDLTKNGSYPDTEPSFDDTDPIQDPAFDLADATQLLQEIAIKLDKKTETVTIPDSEEPKPE